MRDTTTIDNERTAKQKELKVAEDSYHTIRQEILVIQREILERELRKKDLDIGLDKARHIMNVLKLDIEMLKNEYFATRA